MSLSETYNFNPSLGDLVLYAYNLIGLRPTSLLQEHFVSARMASNMVLSRWANQGVNLWQVDLVEVPIVAGVGTYDVDKNTVLILDAYVVVNGIDRVILPISRTEYSSYPNKLQVGITTVFWFDRTLSPTVTIWPVPAEGQENFLRYYRLRRSMDSNMTNMQQVEIPVEWMESFADALAARLAKIWAPALYAALKADADESYRIASLQNIEQSDVYISPMIGGYYR